MFTADNVEVKTSKYQGAGVNEKVVITDISLLELATGKKVIEMKTLNENGQEGKSKRLYLDTTIAEGKTASAWTVSAKYLLNIIMSTGKNTEEAKLVLKADNEVGLVNSLTSNIIGKPFRGLFSSKEYQPGKFAIELYGTEPVGGTRLIFDPSNRFMNSVLPKADQPSSDGLPF